MIFLKIVQKHGISQVVIVKINYKLDVLVYV